MKNLLKLTIIILPVIFISCGTGETYNNENNIHMSREDIMDIVLPEIGYGNAYKALKLMDNEYLKVDKRWLESFKVYFKRKCRGDNFQYMAEKADCDDFARAYAYYAQLFNKKKLPVAVGEFSYPDHVVNIVITTNGIIFIEPQSGDAVELTEKQIENCNMVRF